MAPFETVEAYLSALSGPSRDAVERLRATILAELPGAEERISYGIPAFFVDGRVAMYVAGWKGHVSVYPIPEGDEAYAAETAPYVAGRGTLKFPLSAPLPLELVARTARLHLNRVRGTGQPAG
ncbi:hypothetical protein ASD62_12085 [Phycicoccus sp. Root563]|uniref:iron chaperone n=1 Tax=unclassified Phycicoccus TaxID=2637926 RepID=UPI00070322B1|nr:MULTISPECIES: DUF1801 domain-containing protein [unclassified Phycicoccus]KQU68135.1 hypothetical protein ASC58_11205 [Phycicoccus sp. Root101]KQZ89930.1 hypothetical protein ASD62_12085 [Phycicoccus sp. Root563]